eukprot:1143262-Amphidinium_carterae.3
MVAFGFFRCAQHVAFLLRSGQLLKKKFNLQDPEDAGCCHRNVCCPCAYDSNGIVSPMSEPALLVDSGRVCTRMMVATRFVIAFQQNGNKCVRTVCQPHLCVQTQHRLQALCSNYCVQGITKFSTQFCRT